MSVPESLPVPRPRGGNLLGMFGEEQKAKGRKAQVRNALERGAATPRGTRGPCQGSWSSAAGEIASGGGGRRRNSLEAPEQSGRCNNAAGTRGWWGGRDGAAAKFIPPFSPAPIPVAAVSDQDGYTSTSQRQMCGLPSPFTLCRQPVHYYVLHILLPVTQLPQHILS